MESAKRERVKVDSGSLIHVERNAYSVNSRLIGAQVEARMYLDHVEVWYGQKKVEDLPRLRGRGKHRIDYRHIIRMAGAQARRLRQLPVSRGSVPDQPVSHGLRRAAGKHARASQQRVLEDSATGGRNGRGSGGSSFARTAGGGSGRGDYGGIDRRHVGPTRHLCAGDDGGSGAKVSRDRKSTRLNS